MFKVQVQTADFDVGAEIARLHSGNTAIGAIASFIGLVRENNDGSNISTLTLEHYPGMTEKAIMDIIEEACRRWAICGCTVIHRVGTLNPAERIVLVLVASSHRGPAFDACEFIMDYLKTRAPFWKKEATPGGDRWVEARESDTEAAARWQAGHG